MGAGARRLGRGRDFVPGSDEEGGGRWVSIAPVPRELGRWRAEEVRFRASLTPFRHLAFFPDMAPQWDWMRERLGGAPRRSTCSAIPASARWR